MSRAVFLDMDGVMNSRRYMQSTTEWDIWRPETMLDPAAVALLNVIVEPSDVRVVISSTWRRIFSSGEIAAALAKRGFAYPKKIVGATPRLLGPRSEEIAAWLKEHPGVVSYVILDDDADAQLDGRLVLTNAEVGLTREKAAAAIVMLSISQ